MEIKRQQEIVEAFHYDMIQPDMEVETELKVGFMPIEPADKDYPEENSIVAARLDFRLVFEEYILSGAVSQVNHMINKQIKEQSDVTQEEVDLIVAPLFDIVKRLAYEVTEIALDKPGIQLNFQSSTEE